MRSGKPSGNHSISWRTPPNEKKTFITCIRPPVFFSDSLIECLKKSLVGQGQHSTFSELDVERDLNLYIKPYREARLHTIHSKPLLAARLRAPMIMSHRELVLSQLQVGPSICQSETTFLCPKAAWRSPPNLKPERSEFKHSLFFWRVWKRNETNVTLVEGPKELVSLVILEGLYYSRRTGTKRVTR